MPNTRPLTDAQARFLRALFPDNEDDCCVLAPEAAAIYGTDGSRMEAMPLAVVRPNSTGQVSELLRWARAEKMPIYTRARATNLVGDCVPDPPGVVVSTLRLNKIIEVHPEDFVAVVEPGVVTAQFQAHVEKQGLFYPPDPASLKISTLGGNVATCAGGMRAVKYGVTRDYVLGMEAVLPGGQVLNLGGRTHKNVVGLDLCRLMAGSEGTLGFMTKLILKLLPKPESTASVLAGYRTLAASMEGVRNVFGAGILPTALEFMGREVLRTLAGAFAVPWPADTEAALLFKIDGSAKALPIELDRLRAALAPSAPSYLAHGLGKDEEEPLWELRRSINPASFKVAPNKLSDDITVPRGSVAAALAAFEDIAVRHGLPILTFGHLGDGNIHVNIMFDKSDPRQNAASQAAKLEVFDVVLGLKGSLSGEHGVGWSKLPYLDRQVGAAERALMRTVKAAFDPDGIMNPGKAF
ncbi:MAG: FAD-binding oxidoreductase [Desulfovibrionaceae bacterium]